MRRNHLHPISLVTLWLVILIACTAPAPSATVTPTEAGEPATATLPQPSPTSPPQPAETTQAAVPSAETTAAPAASEGTAGDTTIGDPYAPELGNSGYDVQKHTLRLALDPAEIWVDGSTTIEAVSGMDELGQISLDFIGYDIAELMVDGEAAAYERDGDKLLVSLPRPLDSGQSFTVDVRYQGEPENRPSPYVPFVDHLGLFFQPEQNSLFAVNEPDGARYWFPCNDHPRDKAAFRVELTVPEELTGVSNGQLIETQTEIPNAFSDGRAGDRFIWEHRGPMAPYLATVAVGDYVRVEGHSPGGVALRSYIFREDSQRFEAMQPMIGAAIDWMSEQFGPYPFEEFGYVQVNGVGASLETQTMVVLGSLNPGTMIHEMAHMWFGDWVSLDSWGDIWRNEGFATYTEALWAEEQNGPAALEGTVEQWRSAFAAQPDLPPLNNPAPEEMFGSGSYFRGALLAHELREAVGDEAFFAGLRLYFERYGGATATHEQFVQALEEAAGAELDGVFEGWLEAEAVVP